MILGSRTPLDMNSISEISLIPMTTNILASKKNFSRREVRTVKKMRRTENLWAASHLRDGPGRIPKEKRRYVPEEAAAKSLGSIPCSALMLVVYRN
jgi:hypothetical protein